MAASYIITTTNGELYHHGILGMKWGIRRYQNADGTRTELGKRRLRNAQNAETDYNNAVIKGKSAKVQSKLKDRSNFAKEDYKDYLLSERIQDKKIKQKYIDLYKSKGYSDEDAKVAAYKRQKVERALLVVGAIGLTAAGIYVGKKIYDQYADKTLKAGTLLKRVESNNLQSVHDGFYAILGKHERRDGAKYIGLYGMQNKANGGTQWFQKTLEANKDIKIASPENARKALESYFNNNPKAFAEFKTSVKDFSDEINNNPLNKMMLKKHAKLFKKAEKDLNKGKITKNVYKAYDFKGIQEAKAAGDTGFFDELRKRGYDAIKDQNDSIGGLSGYNSKNPLIFLNGKDFKVNSVKDVQPEINKNLYKGQLKVALHNPDEHKKLAAYGAAFAGYKGYKSYKKTQKNDQIVSQYKKEHPGTKLSYKEILRNYYGLE